MAEKMKKHLSRRAQERLNAQLRSFDLVMLALGAVIVLSGVVCFFGDPSFSGSEPAGFALWFLRVYAVLPLALWHGVKALLKLPGGMSRGYGLYLFPAIAFIWNFVLWLVIRIAGRHYNKSSLLHVSTRFAQMFLLWGIFQLICVGTAAGCRHNMRPPAESTGKTVQSAPAEIQSK